MMIGSGGGRQALSSSVGAGDGAGLGRAAVDPQAQRLELVVADRRQAIRHRRAGDLKPGGSRLGSVAAASFSHR